MQVDIRELLIERIRELRNMKASVSSHEARRSIEDLELFNVNLYYKIFGSKI